MADLSAMYMNFANNTGRATERGFLGAQQMMENQLAYQKAKEDLEAQRGLRALFAQNPSATPEEVSRYSPQFGMEMVKAQQEAQERSGRMTKTQREISEMEAKAVAETLGPIAERAKLTGDLNAFKVEMGQAASALAQQGIPLPMNFNPEQHTPDLILQNSIARGYKSPLMENQMAYQKEQMLSQVPPRMSSEQAYGGVDMGAYGPMLKPPLPRQPKGTGMGGAPAAQLPEGYQRATAADLPVLEEAYNNASDINEKQQIGSLINQLRQQTQASAQSQFVTPEQQMELKAEEAALTQTKKAEAEKEMAAKEQLSTLQALDTRNVEDLIDKSMSSLPEQAFKEYGMSTGLGKATEANTATSELRIISAQMRDMAKAIVGAGPISEGEQKIISNALGDIASAKDPESRKTSYRAFVDLAKEKMKKYPHLAQQANAINEMSAPEPSNQQIPVTVKSRADVQALPSGTLFIGPDGKTHRRK